jgi:N-acetylmuramoyl-L-alanine amidase
MPKYIVKQGECFSSIAARHGVDPETLYRHPGNAELKGKRPFFNILAPGDAVEVPDVEKKTLVAATGELHTFVITWPKVRFRVFVANSRREPYEDRPYVLTIGRRTFKGRTKPGGLIECMIPAHEQSGRLQVWWSDEEESPIVERQLAIGHLDPIDMISGIQGRLLNLGFICELTGKYDQVTLMALRRFRLKNDLPMPQVENGSSSPSGSADTSESSGSDDATTKDGSTGLAATDDSENAYSRNPAAECEKLVDDALRSKLQELYEG